MSAARSSLKTTRCSSGVMCGDLIGGGPGLEGLIAIFAQGDDVSNGEQVAREQLKNHLLRQSTRVLGHSPEIGGKGSQTLSVMVLVRRLGPGSGRGRAPM